MKISRMNRLFSFTTLFLLISSSFAQAMPAQVLLIRHGEKPETGSELSEKGWQRAKAMPSLFHSRAELLKFGEPVALIGMSPKKKKGSVRAIQTLKYVAEDLHLTINSTFTDNDVEDMVKHVKETTSYEGKFVVICWNHDSMKDIAKEFGVHHAPKMDGDTFDRGFLITFADQNRPDLREVAEKLLPGDSE